MIGGIYSYKHPIFHNALNLTEKNEILEVSNINNALQSVSKNSSDTTYLYSDSNLVKVTENLPENLNKKELNEIKEEIKNKINNNN